MVVPSKCADFNTHEPSHKIPPKCKKARQVPGSLYALQGLVIVLSVQIGL